jgi:hypothetical protein
MKSAVSNTPWGPALGLRWLSDDVCYAATSTHGGFFVSAAKNENVPAYLRIQSGWYEHDSEWARIGVVFTDLFKPEDVKFAQQILMQWEPDLYEKFTCRLIQPGESLMKDRSEFERVHANDFIGVAAFGDWFANVPKDMVLVAAAKGGRDKHGAIKGEERYYLVPSAEYTVRSLYGFVITASHHQTDPNIYPGLCRN